MIDALITTIIGGLGETNELAIAGILGGIGAIVLIAAIIGLMAL